MQGRGRGATLAVVFPAFNEQERLPRLLAALPDCAAAVAAAGFTLAEIVVVDDGSTDATPDLLAGATGVRTVRLPANRGKGAAVAAGVLSTGADFVLVSDVDLSTPIHELGALADADADVVLGSRAVDRTKVLVRQSPAREYLGRGFNLLVRLATGLPFRDTQCGFKLFRGDAARALFAGLRTDGFAYDVEVLLAAKRLGLSTKEVPVTWRNEPHTTVSIRQSVPAMARDLARLSSERLLTVALLAAATALLAVLTPHVGSINDGARYLEIGRHPLSNDVGTPWSLRIGIPLLASALPFSLDTSFFVLAALSVFGSGLLVAAIVRALGLPERHARAGGVLAIWTGLSVTCFWSDYVDVHVLFFVALTVWLALSKRTRAIALLTAVGASVKEVIVLCAALPAFVRGRAAIRPSAVAAVAGLVVYGAIDLVVPHGAAQHGGLISTQIKDTRWWFHELWRIGIVRYTGNAILSVFGITWLFWWQGFRAAPPWLRRGLFWVPLTLPLFLTTQWERTFAFYLPLALPLALLGLRRYGAVPLALVTAGSAWVAGWASLHTVADDRVTSGMHKLLLMSPGFAIAAVGVLLGSTALLAKLRHQSPGAPGIPAAGR